jgi:hypothetical protein
MTNPSVIQKFSETGGLFCLAVCKMKRQTINAFIMKKIILLCFSVLFTNFIWSQSISVNSSGIAEVGISQNFQLTLTAGSSGANTHYRIDNWLIIANIGSGIILGNINEQYSSSYYYNPPLNQINSISNPVTINIPITYGSNAPDTDNVEFQVSGFFGTLDSNGNFVPITSLFKKYSKSNGDSGYAVDVKIVCSPTISNPTILNCCTNNVQFCAIGYCDANVFTWVISGGTIASGQGTSCVTVTPNASGNVLATCVVKRSSGLPNYTATNTKTINRTARTIAITSSNSAYICAGVSKIFQIDNQCGMTGATWSATNSTVSAETVVNGKRQVTVTPNANLTTGSHITVNATANFSGGCTATNRSVVYVGTPRTTLPGATCYTTNAPCSVIATTSNNYLNFTLSAPLGNYAPLYGDWEWQKISGNFYFLSNINGQYNATTRNSPQADMYLTGANPTDNPLKFKTRVKSECGWGDWTEYVWNDGTTTVVTPPPPPAKYFVVAPNPTGGYSANISLLNPSILPPTTSPITANLYTIFGQLLSNTQLYNNSGMVYLYSFPYNTMYISISFGTHTETHTVVKY